MVQSFTKPRLKLDKDVVREIYKHVDKLTDTKYKNPLDCIRTRHKTYSPEDFVQDSIVQLLSVFDKKSFESISKLKSYLNYTIENVYSHEVRKYFATQSRGACDSLDDDLYENQKVGDTVPAKSKDLDIELMKHNLMSKNLYVLVYRETYTVGTLRELKHKFTYKSTLLSVNYFLEKQIEYGLRDTVALYKVKGFYMTQSIYMNISQAIVSYAEMNGLLTPYKDIKTYTYNRNVDDRIASKVQKVSKCSCGYVNKDYKLTELFWQCPNCGKTHSRDGILEGETSKSEDTLYVSDIIKERYNSNPLKVL